MSKIEVEVELPERLHNYRFPKPADDPKKAIRASINVLNIGPKKIMYPLVSMPYLSVLTTFFIEAGYRPSMVPYLWGESGSFKSTLMALILSHHGTFTSMTLPASFRGTTFSVEEMGYTLKDSLFVVDDLKRTTDRVLKQKMFTVLGNLLRIYGDGQDRSRLESNKESSGMKLQKYRPAGGLLVVTGEYSPTDGSSPSDLARMFSLPIKKGDIDGVKLTEAQGQTELLAQSMLGYIEWSIPQLDDMPARLEYDFIKYRTKAQKSAKAGRHERLNSAVAHLYMGLWFFFRFAVDMEAMTQEDMDKRLDEAWKVLNDDADEQTELGKKHDEAQVLAEVYSELMAQNLIYTLPMNGPIQPKSGFDEPVNPRRPRVLVGYGPDKNGLYYMMMSTLIDQVNGMLSGQGEINNLITVDGVLVALDSKKLLVLEDSKAKKHDRQFRKTIGGGTKYVSAIKEEFFNQPAEVEE